MKSCSKTTHTENYQIKHVISNLCELLRFHTDINIAADVFRRAKLNEEACIEPLCAVTVSLLFKLCNYSTGGKHSIELESGGLSNRNFVNKLLDALGFGASSNNLDDRAWLNDSRYFLVAVSWLLTKYAVLDTLIGAYDHFAKPNIRKLNQPESKSDSQVTDLLDEVLATGQACDFSQRRTSTSIDWILNVLKHRLKMVDSCVRNDASNWIRFLNNEGVNDYIKIARCHSKWLQMRPTYFKWVSGTLNLIDTYQIFCKSGSEILLKNNRFSQSLYHVSVHNSLWKLLTTDFHHKKHSDQPLVNSVVESYLSQLNDECLRTEIDIKKAEAALIVTLENLQLDSLNGLIYLNSK